MNALEDAMAEIDDAEEDVQDAEIRTKLDSIGASLQEMLDTLAGEETSNEVVLADSDVTGAAPHDDHLVEIETNLEELAENAEDPEVRKRLGRARRHVRNYRDEAEGTERDVS